MTAPKPRTIQVTVNGETITASVPDRKLLCDFLREDLSLTGTHVGCEHGVCGACTVLVEGRPARSCLMLAVQADGRAITTIEGVSGPDGSLHPVQRAFHEQHALQCGFCTPGFIISTIAYLEERDPSAGPVSEDEVREHLSGTLCRCTGYTNIVRAVCQAAAELSES
ncbi:(2Fe-2S)-binding protein [Ferruginivarius sediminum]|uniref:(2Fe-2S)-binding protein n=1 Tax=Ferruginivarius sediminum TaxID=2661937 RepID=A0A369T5L7_9PROT|nr:(2Fe-2S)-binding protein [Ferruginivarius sediminum]RDD60619.1 (2Fe-2S)-binding protein [Ferruginivarius sediminum]